jgi:ribosomal protein S18 acetylase RimI-like enzyme
VVALDISAHDSHPPDETALVDAGLGASNQAAAPLHEVQPVACFARSATGEVLGGAIGRRWGACCELQQLWVAPTHRRRGIATRLIRAFEAHAQSRGCSSFYLETFSFQAPALYESLGYRVTYEHDVYPHGIARFVMVKHLAAGAPAA